MISPKNVAERLAAKVLQEWLELLLIKHPPPPPARGRAVSSWSSLSASMMMLQGTEEKAAG